MAYNLNQVAMITGLTTRTLRNHLKQGLLNGEKIDGVWSFTEEELDEYVREPAVRQAIASRQHAVVYDFLADSVKKTNRVCTILDFPVSDGESLSIANFFSGEVSRHGSDIEFRFIKEKHFARFILAGAEDQVSDFMKAYYAR